MIVIIIVIIIKADEDILNIKSTSLTLGCLYRSEQVLPLKNVSEQSHTLLLIHFPLLTQTGLQTGL